MKPFFRYTLVLCSAVSLALEALALPIQDTTNTTRKKVARADEITITALRQPEKALEVPLAITVVPKSLFENSRGFGLDEALSLVPGVLVQSRTGNQDVRVMIRGFGARGAGERSNAGTSRGIRFYIDGIPETEPDGRTAFDLIDLSGATSIEVLRSNASALWGNAAGGVVSINTIPEIDRPYLSLQAQFGSFGFQKQSLRAGTPTDIGKIYISVNNTQFEGYRAQSQSALSQFYVGLLSNLSPKTRFNTFITGASNAFQIPGPLTQEQFDANPAQAQNDAAIYSPTYVQRNERRFNRLGRIGTTFEHQFDAQNTLSAMTFLQSKVLQRSERNTFRDFNRYHAGGNLIFRNATRFSDIVHASFLAGGDIQYQDGALLFYNQVNGQRGTRLQTNKREGAQNLGAFAQAEVMIGSSLSVTGGLRYDNIAYFNEDFINPKINENRAFERLTPKLGITYHITPLWTIYANLGGGVEVPAGNETDPPSVFGEDTVRSINVLLKPIESTTYEIGTKSILLTDAVSFLSRLSFDVALYQVNVVNDIIPYRGGRFYFTAGRSQRRGAEASLQAEFQGGLSLMATATYSDNRFVEYRIDSGFVSRALEGRFVSYAGNKMPGIPDFFSSVRLRYQPNFAPQFFTEFEWRTVATYFANDANTLTAPAFSVVDGTVGFRQAFLDERLHLSAFVRGNNLLNSKYVASIWINPDRATNGQYPFIEPGLPLNYVASFGVEWRF
ncbi:MAG: TonB-dependent receptor [Candidatus Kapabacteria bacterium]|jgi:iron complex outermembrane receptor protein|nr:TonB-dependent receptor [Candidatus Kapabacteria bacterium]